MSQIRVLRHDHYSFVLSDTEDNTSGPSNEGRSRFTSVKNTIINFPKVTRAKFLGDDSFILLAISKFSSLKKTITRLSESQFRCKSILVVHIRDFYQVWPQHKQLKTLKINKASPYNYHKECIHQFQPGPSTKFSSSSKST